jgi:sulfonate transport system ATP-binding protein
MSNDLSVKITEKYVNASTNPLQVLGSCHFELKPGELLVVLGESGCGKSTLLRLILTLDNEFVGSITSAGNPITARYPNRGIVFQEPRLLPWLTTLQNVEFALGGEDEGDVRRNRALSMINLVGLQGFEKNLPRELSGGMAQRAALARALVNMPEILLLDEPFGALDLHTRFRLQNELLNILKKTNTTTMLVTHDIDEALYLGDRVLVMTKRPGSVRSVHSISVPKPRERTGTELVPLREKLLQELIGD